MKNEDNARLLAIQIKEEVGMSQHSVERISEIIRGALDQKDKSFAAFLDRKRGELAARLEDMTEECSCYFVLYTRYVYLGILIDEICDNKKK